MSEKVKLPRDVAKAIEFYSKPQFDYTKYGVLDNIAGEGLEVAVKARNVLRERYGEGLCWDVLMEALVNGYEVEETPEENVKDLFEYFGQTIAYSGLDVQNKIKIMFNLLNIRIKGVNADE